MFSINDVETVIGVKGQTLRNWVTVGIIEPAQWGTTGTGNGHMFSLMQLFAIYVGLAYKKVGATPSTVASVISCLERLSTEELALALQEHRTFVVPDIKIRGNTIKGTLIAPLENTEIVARLSVQSLYSELTNLLLNYEACINGPK